MTLPEQRPRIERSEKFRELLKTKSIISISVFTAIMAAVSFVLTTGFQFWQRVVVIASIVLIGGFLIYVQSLRQFTIDLVDPLSKQVEDLEQKVDELKGYNALLDAKYTLPVRLRSKQLEYEISEDGADLMTYTYEVAPEGSTPVDKFYALIGIMDQSITYDELDLSFQGASERDHKRRDYANWVRFIVELELHERVSPGSDPHTFSMQASLDGLDIEEDFVNPLVRHETELIETRIRLEEGWEVEYVKEDFDEEACSDLSYDDIPSAEKNDGEIRWECRDCEVGNSYHIKWGATKVSSDTSDAQRIPVEDTPAVNSTDEAGEEPVGERETGDEDMRAT